MRKSSHGVPTDVLQYNSVRYHKVNTSIIINTHHDNMTLLRCKDVTVSQRERVALRGRDVVLSLHLRVKCWHGQIVMPAYYTCSRYIRMNTYV